MNPAVWTFWLPWFIFFHIFETFFDHFFCLLNFFFILFFYKKFFRSCWYVSWKFFIFERYPNTGRSKKTGTDDTVSVYDKDPIQCINSFKQRTIVFQKSLLMLYQLNNVQNKQRLNPTTNYKSVSRQRKW